MTSGSVCIQRRKVGVKATPAAVRKSPLATPKASTVWMPRETCP